MEPYKLLDWKRDFVSGFSKQKRHTVLYNYKKIEKINRIYDAFGFVDFSIKNIVKSHINLITDIKYGNDFTSKVELDFVREQNYLLSNLLSAFRNYVDTTNNVLSKLSKPLQRKFKKETESIYDSNPFYRICYRLRNYSQHYAFPIKCAVKHTRLHDEKVSPVISLITPVIHKRELLEAKSIWNDMTRNDLKSFPDEIDAKEIIWELGKAIEELQFAIGVPLYRARMKSLERLSDLVKHGASSFSPSNFYIVRSDKSGQVDTLSLEIIQMLDRQTACPKLTDFRNILIGLIPNIDLEKSEYKGGVFSISAAGPGSVY